MKKAAALVAVGSMAWSVGAQTVDLATGNSGRIGSVLFEFTETQPTGTGYIDPFVRIQKRGVEEGYNTSGRPFAFDEKNPFNYTHDVQVKDLGGGTNINGIVYYQFLLDINEPAGDKALLSLDEIRLYLSPTGEKTTRDISELGRLIYSTGDDWILLDYARNHGSGSGDMYMFVPKSLFAGASPEDYLYLYSKFGSYHESKSDDAEAGFEEWAIIVHPESPCPEIAATGGTIDCETPSVQLRVTSDVAGSTFSWTGPNGFTSTMQNPTVNAAGNYTVTVSNGNCSATAVAVVVDQRATFSLLTQTADLDCETRSVTLGVSSSLANVTYTWTGPGIVSGVNTANPVVDRTGIYTVVARDPVTGCEATQTAPVRDRSVNVVVEASGGPLNCEQTSVQLRATSGTPGVTYTWSGPNGFTSTEQNPLVRTPGTYTVTATAGGCVGVATATVTDERRTIAVTAADSVITCDNPSVQLRAICEVPGVTYAWTGPGIVSGGNTATPTVNVPGSYTVVVQDGVSGCEATAVARVTQQQTDFTVQAQGGAIDCISDTVILRAIASLPGATFRWSGPGIVAGGDTANVTVNIAGTYTVTATVNGCSVTATTGVSGDANAGELPLSLPPGAVAFKVHSAPHATFEFELQDVPPGYSVSNGKYTAWCIEQDDGLPTGVVWPGTMHSTRNAPAGWQHFDWRKVNYIINNKRTATAEDVQKAIWHYVGRSTIEPLQLTATAQALVTEAEENADCFTPGSTGVTGVIVAPTDDFQQVLFVELPVQAAAPALAAELNATGELAITVSAPVNSTVVLESSTDLRTWTTMETVTGHNGRVTRPVRPTQAEKGRFFRTRVQ